MNIKKIALTSIGILALVIVTVLGVASSKPDDFVVTRSLSMNAAPKEIFVHINELKKWHAWSPWAKIDPNAALNFEGPENGVDTKMSWDGNSELGAGSMTITESRPYEYIKLNLLFTRPFKGENITEFTFEPKDGETLVTWKMFGHNDFAGKVMSVFVDLETMVGSKYEEGLANLKALVEG